MDSTYIAPLITATRSVFEMMLQLPIEASHPAIKEPGIPSHDVSGIIGMSGDVEGAFVLSFSVETGERLVSLFVGEHIEHTHEDFADAVGELINMISGSAKAQFKDKHVNIACPSVIVGQNHRVFSRKNVSCIVIPCTCDCGEFTVEISYRNEGGGSAATTAGAESAEA